MATVIRLKRGGRAHSPYYRVVVVDSRNRLTGAVLEELGVYHPCAKPEPTIDIDAAKTIEWLSKGARPSDTVRTVLKNKGIMAAFTQQKTAKTSAGA